MVKRRKLGRGEGMGDIVVSLHTRRLHGVAAFTIRPATSSALVFTVPDSRLGFSMWSRA